MNFKKFQIFGIAFQKYCCCLKFDIFPRLMSTIQLSKKTSQETKIPIVMYALNSWLSDCSLLAATQIWSQFVNVHHSHLWIYLSSKKEIGFRIMIEDRKRFDRCLTPMGTVPISVIYGWNNCYLRWFLLHQLKTRFHYPGEQKSATPPSTLSAPRRGTKAVPVVSSASPSWPMSLATVRLFIKDYMYSVEKLQNFRGSTQTSSQACKNDRVIKSVEPSSRHTKFPSPTRRDTNISLTSKYVSLKSNVATKTEDTSRLPVRSRDLLMIKSYTSTWRSPLRLFVKFPKTFDFYCFVSATAISLHIQAAGQDLIWVLHFLISEGNFSNLDVMR